VSSSSCCFASRYQETGYGSFPEHVVHTNQGTADT
jgi:hypothetical protein